MWSRFAAKEMVFEFAAIFLLLMMTVVREEAASALQAVISTGLTQLQGSVELRRRWACEGDSGSSQIEAKVARHKSQLFWLSFASTTRVCAHLQLNQRQCASAAEPLISPRLTTRSQASLEPLHHLE